MDKSKRELEAIVASQKEQLSRYEKRLKDVVTAYKGLLKEKEALETSLTAITKDAPSSSSKNSHSVENIENKKDSPNENASNSSGGDAEKSDLQTQIVTLMNSLATLSAEKSRMEASFQADKKHLRTQLTQKDETICELHTKIKESEARAKSDVEEMKAKWIIERQEREKEVNNQMLMIRELQKLYADERHLKENIEMQLNNFKTQFANNEEENSRRELQKQLKETKLQLKQLQTSSKRNASVDEELTNSAEVLKQVQQQMRQLKEQHAIAIKNEQRRVLLAEEQSKKQAALHEDRVANLEARLAELSSTVGRYDRLRQQDQESIQTLKRKLQELERNSSDLTIVKETEQRQELFQDSRADDISTIVAEIVRLKKQLMTENARATNPIDVNKVFTTAGDHVQCQVDLNRVQQDWESSKREISTLLEKIELQKSHISTLQEKVVVLNRNIDEQEMELKQQNEKLRHAVNGERQKWKDTITELENEHRCRVNDLEQQLQKQRQRSLQLLDEKEQEIKTLQTSFEIYQNATMPTPTNTNNDQNNYSSDAESNDGGSTMALNKTKLKAKKLSVGENCHMLHYVNEIARKDIEIAGLRKAKYTAETSLRKSIHDKVTAQQELNEKIVLLEEQVDRLERCKTREGANLEYLKNVIISYILTKDAESNKHMLNAISAVLQFTPAEIQAINAATFHKK